MIRHRDCAGLEQDTEEGIRVELLEKAFSIENEVREWRRHIHRHPELGMETEGTASFIEKVLNEIGVENVRRCGKTGVVALIEGALPGDCVGLRADIDALPVLERNDLPYRSCVEGVAHACAHDVHAACLLGAAKLLHGARSTMKGSVKLIFQPGEEVMAGAAAMIEDGVLENPKMKAVYALHAWPELPAGMIGLRNGPVMAGSQWVYITVKGSQGHAAHPHRCVDSVLISGHIICALQSVMSREIAPLESGVLSLCKIEGGTAGNILPEEVRIAGTVRALYKEVNQQILDAAKRIVEGTAAALRGSATFEAPPGLPPVFNEPEAYAKIRDAFEYAIGKDRLMDLPYPSMGGEDFAFFLDKVPGGHFRIGVGPKEGTTPPLHSPDFVANEECLPYGSAAYAAIALDELGSLR